MRFVLLFSSMTHPISVRLDEKSRLALTLLEGQGLTRSEAIRSSLVSAAARIRDEQTLAAEVATLETDETDRAEMRAVAAMMDELRAPW